MTGDAIVTNLHDAAKTRDVSLVLGGGNALGAYHLGVCERLFRSEIRPGWLLGASIGAVTAAILAGNPPEQAIDRLAEFWRFVAQPESLDSVLLPESLRAQANNWFALAALIGGRPGMFYPRWPGVLSLFPFAPPDRAIGDHRAMAATLTRFIDFDRLNSGRCRLSIIALDIQTGEEVWFDTRNQRITPEHILASTAFAPMFPPVEIDGRLLGDPGFANNLPVDRVFRESSSRERLCIAVDLFMVGHRPPETLDQAAVRVQDIAMASQSRRSLAWITREHELAHQIDPAAPRATIAYLAYQAAGHERTLKSLDFSAQTIQERIGQGWRDMQSMLSLLKEPDQHEPLTLLRLDQSDALPKRERRTARR